MEVMAMKILLHKKIKVRGAGSILLRTCIYDIFSLRLMFV